MGKMDKSCVLEGSGMVEIPTPGDNGWYWKQICRMKDKFSAGYVHNGWLAYTEKYSIRSGYQWGRGIGKQWPWWRWV